MALSADQRARIQATFTRYLATRAKNAEKLSLADLKFNVVHLRTNSKMLDLSTPLDLIRYRLAQHLERGATTAMGTVLQAVAREITGSGTGVAGADIEVVRNGQRYYIQVKSGPDTANKDIAQNIGALLNSARARDPAAACLLGVCYARPEQISGIAKKELEARGVGLKVGREFWEFISGDPDCMTEILELAAAAADTPIEGESFADRIERKVQEITAEFEAKYGNDLDDPQTWANFLADNS